MKIMKVVMETRKNNNNMYECSDETNVRKISICVCNFSYLTHKQSPNKIEDDLFGLEHENSSNNYLIYLYRSVCVPETQ